MFINVVPFDRSPYGIPLFPTALITGNGISTLGPRITQWNAALPQFVNGFLNQYSDISVTVYDVHTLFTTVLNNWESYGFKDAVSQCHISDCIWADGVHSTFAMHRIIAADLAQVLRNPTATVSTTSGHRVRVG